VLVVLVALLHASGSDYEDNGNEDEHNSDAEGRHDRPLCRGSMLYFPQHLPRSQPLSLHAALTSGEGLHGILCVLMQSCEEAPVRTSRS